jgi:CBS domain-containing protein
MNIGQMMTQPVFTVTPSDSVAFAEEMMNRELVRHLPVVDGDILVGLISQRDVLAVSLPSLSAPSEDDDLEYKRRLSVSKIMRGFVEAVRPDTDATEAADKLLDTKVGCLPVVDERLHVVGIVTESDFVRLARDLLTKPRR